VSKTAAPPAAALGRVDTSWTDGAVHTGVGDVPRAKSALDARDHLGSLRVRWNIGRLRYRVPPGLYAVGEPDAEAPVLVSANYKLSFDRLRSVLSCRSAWILVLDTKGINVWCAAGKGTFGTDELVRRVESCALDRVVSHRRLVVPQLGAPGVSAPEVRRRSGFRVEYGPVRAEDLPAFLDAGLKATPEMRRVRFGLWDRLVLVPVELTIGAKKALLAAAGMVLLGGLNASGYSVASVRSVGLVGAAFVIGSFLLASILGPALLPWLPGRAFSLKGALLGLAAFVGLAVLGTVTSGSWLHAASWALMMPAISSFVVMSFTGASTFTSQSGVLREMRVAVPSQIAASVLGLGLWLTALFVPGGR
jgi:acetyl-CoA decarbonylase/synthase complex subunit gamma